WIRPRNGTIRIDIFGGERGTDANIRAYRRSSADQFIVEFDFHIFDALAQVEIFLPLLRLFGEVSQQMEEKIEPDFAVLDRNSEVPKALEVLANAFDLAANKFIVLDG